MEPRDKYDEDSVSLAVSNLLMGFGFNPYSKEHAELAITVQRVAKTWKELLQGHTNSLDDKIKVFPNDEKFDQMIVQTGLDYFSMCEHHLLPFFGTITIGYIPDENLIGISKLARIAKHFSCRLQLQERMTNQIANYLFDHKELQPLGVGVHVEGYHLCMAMRGIRKINHKTITTALRGRFYRPSVRKEFLGSVNK